VTESLIPPRKPAITDLQRARNTLRALDQYTKSEEGASWFSAAAPRHRHESIGHAVALLDECIEHYHTARSAD
jgi:hypothetical protein